MTRIKIQKHIIRPEWQIQTKSSEISFFPKVRCSNRKGCFLAGMLIKILKTGKVDTFGRLMDFEQSSNFVCCKKKKKSVFLVYINNSTVTKWKDLTESLYSVQKPWNIFSYCFLSISHNFLFYKCWQSKPQDTKRETPAVYWQLFVIFVSTEEPGIFGLKRIRSHNGSHYAKLIEEIRSSCCKWKPRNWISIFMAFVERIYALNRS